MTRLVRVKVRWKDVDAGADDGAHETTASLTPQDVADDLHEAADPDFLFAAGLAAGARRGHGPRAGEANRPSGATALVAARRQARRPNRRAALSNRTRRRRASSCSVASSSFTTLVAW